MYRLNHRKKESPIYAPHSPPEAYTRNIPDTPDTPDMIKIRKKEKPVEQKLVQRIEAAGGWAVKLQGTAGLPDRLILLPVPQEDREVVSRYVRFVETKAPSKTTLRPMQEEVLGRLREMGYVAEVDRGA